VLAHGQSRRGRSLCSSQRVRRPRSRYSPSSPCAGRPSPPHRRAERDGGGGYALDFTLICRVASFVDPSLSQHELRKRILRRFREKGIEIPLPVRTVELRRRRPAGRAAAELAGPAAGG